VKVTMTVFPLEEMVELLRAVRSYEANVTAFNAAKSMALKALAK
jgi:flagellar basal-body rod protein FlgC